LLEAMHHLSAGFGAFAGTAVAIVAAAASLVGAGVSLDLVRCLRPAGLSGVELRVLGVGVDDASLADDVVARGAEPFQGLVVDGDRA
jgi:hypothetical protein